MSNTEKRKHRFQEQEFGTVAFLLDVLLVALFAYLGRLSHDLEISAAGIFETGWPFLIGLVVSRVIPVVNKKPMAVYPSGVIVYASAFIVGMGIRVIYTANFSLPFTLVACGMLAVLLVGYRTVIFGIRWLVRKGK